MCFWQFLWIIFFCFKLQYPAGTLELPLAISESSGISAIGSPTTGAQVGYKRSAFIGSCKHEVWKAIRASSAAPYYLDDYSDGILFLYLFKLTHLLAIVTILFLIKMSILGLSLFLVLFSLEFVIFSYNFSRCTPVARWCNSGEQSYNFCHKRSTASLAWHKNWQLSFHWVWFCSYKGNYTLLFCFIRASYEILALSVKYQLFQSNHNNFVSVKKWAKFCSMRTLFLFRLYFSLHQAHIKHQKVMPITLELPTLIF